MSNQLPVRKFKKSRKMQRTVGAVSVSILVSVVERNSLAPLSTALERDVVDVDTCISFRGQRVKSRDQHCGRRARSLNNPALTSVDNVDINTLASIRIILVFLKRAQAQALPVGYPRESPRRIVLHLARPHRLVCLDKVDFGRSTDEAQRALVEMATVPLKHRRVELLQPDTPLGGREVTESGGVGEEGGLGTGVDELCVRSEDGEGRGGLEDDDVVVGDYVGIGGDVHRRKGRLGAAARLPSIGEG